MTSTLNNVKRFFNTLIIQYMAPALSTNLIFSPEIYKFNLEIE